MGKIKVNAGPVKASVDKDVIKTVAETVIGTGEIIADRIERENDKIADKIGHTYGVIHKREPAEINGKKGYLTWDWILCNEITFEDEDGKITRFFQSMSDKKTEERWNELVEKYGI